MKKIFFACFLALSFVSFDWKTDITSASEDARANKKLILLNFSGSDWCIPCRKLKKGLFSDTSFLQYADKCLILVNADFPNKKGLITDEQLAKNEKLAEKYNPNGDFPLTLILDSNGNVLKTWKGLIDMSSADFIQSIDKIYPSADSTKK